MRLMTWLAASALVFMTASPALSAVSFTPREIYARAAPAVVFISAYDSPNTIGGAGTGSVITPEGLVVTNSHVVTNPASGKVFKNIVACLKPSKITGMAEEDLRLSFFAEIIARNPELDLALLKLVRAPAPLPIIMLGEASSVSTGDPVAAIGHPEGGGLWILTTGTISGVKRIGVKDVFQTEASINRGNSGGPLLDSAGAMIGINTSMVRRAEDGSAIVGVNFALQSMQVKTWLSSQGVRPANAPTRQQDKVASAEAGPPDKSSELKNQPRDTAETKQDAGPVKKQGQTGKAASEPLRPEKADAMDKPGDDLKEFRGPNGELMYGIPEGKFTLDEAVRLVFKKSRENAQKYFQELDNLEKDMKR